MVFECFLQYFLGLSGVFERFSMVFEGAFDPFDLQRQLVLNVLEPSSWDR